jgi:hypothetical protein
MADKNLEDNEVITIENDDVVNKYKTAAEVSNCACLYINNSVNYSHTDFARMSV